MTHELTIHPLQFESLVRGFTVSETEGWGRVSPDEYLHIPAVVAYPQAFKDGVELKHKVNMIVSCDSNADWDRDKASYDRFASELNEKYGRVAVLTSEIDKTSPGYGIIGYRFAPFSSVTITTFTNGSEETAVDFPATRVQMEDEKTRPRSGFNF